MLSPMSYKCCAATRSPIREKLLSIILWATSGISHFDLVGEFMQLEPDEQSERRASWREARLGAN